MRNGADVKSLPLPPGAHLSSCVAACCASPACVAFSFNSPQPAHTCVGGTCCELGSTCCMLKDGPGVVEPNPWAGNVSTGLLPPRPLPPGPTPPFPVSTALGGVVFGAPQAHPKSIGDTWPSATGADGHLYGWGCDSDAGPMALWRIEGDATRGEPLTPTLVSNTSWAEPVLDFAALCGWLGKTGTFPNINIKPGGMVGLPPSPDAPNGTLLVGVSCMQYGSDPGFNRQTNLAGFAAVSLDSGRTFRNVTPSNAFMGRFAAPVFVKGADPDYLFAFFPGSYDNAAYWDNNDAHFLGRVPVDAFAAPAQYTYFVGLDGAGAPVWSSDSSQAQPVLEFGSMLGENVVTYHAPLGRYLVAQYGFIDNEGKPRPWHSEPYMSPHRTQLLLLEAPNPWGPWRSFYVSQDSPPAPGLYTPSFPEHFMRAPVGGKATLVMLFACLDTRPDPACQYTLNWVNVTVIVNPPTSLAVGAPCAMPPARPAPADRKFVSASVEAYIAAALPRFADPNLATLFSNTLPNTLDTTVFLHNASAPDTFIVTGDILAMWQRDSTNQVWPYLRFIATDAPLRTLVAGLIARQASNVLISPYANAFQLNASRPGPHADDSTLPASAAKDNRIFEFKYELDSMSNVLRLSAGYFAATGGDTSPFTATWLAAVRLILATMTAEQRGSAEEDATGTQAYGL